MARGSSARVIVEELERGDLSDRGLLIKMKRVNFWDGVILGGGNTFLFFFFFYNQSIFFTDYKQLRISYKY